MTIVNHGDRLVRIGGERVEALDRTDHTLPSGEEEVRRVQVRSGKAFSRVVHVQRLFSALLIATSTSDPRGSVRESSEARPVVIVSNPAFSFSAHPRFFSSVRSQLTI